MLAGSQSAPLLAARTAGAAGCAGPGAGAGRRWRHPARAACSEEGLWGVRGGVVGTLGAIAV